MTNTHAVQCPQCQQTFRDEETLRGHGLREHTQTRQQHQQQHADVVTQQKQQATDRQQDVAGRRESAGQPSEPAGSEQPGSEPDRERVNAARPGEEIGQQTQQQQRQVQ